MGFRKAPADFDCPYQRACPHMDGISAKWAFSVFRKKSQIEEQIRRLESELDTLRAENNELRIERDQIQARFTALHRKQFKAGKAKAAPSPAPTSEKPKETRAAHRASALESPRSRTRGSIRFRGGSDRMPTLRLFFIASLQGDRRADSRRHRHSAPPGGHSI